MLRIVGGPRFASRGGIKLEHAIHHFGVNGQDSVVLDVGASTGGFTECLLKYGARRVYALDVGRGQLSHQLRIDPRVIVMEQTNARHSFLLPEKLDLITVDVSFISLTKVLHSVTEHLTFIGALLVLVKPQFEAPKKDVGRGGIIRDPIIHAKVLGNFCLWAIAEGWYLDGITASPIEGQEGNREFFVLLHRFHAT